MKSMEARLTCDEQEAGIFLVVEMDGTYSGEIKVWFTRVQHGTSVHGRDILAVLDGKFCGCPWCEALKRRTRSRRLG